jgi:hypothetical protein
VRRCAFFRAKGSSANSTTPAGSIRATDSERKAAAAASHAWNVFVSYLDSTLSYEVVTVSLNAALNPSSVRCSPTTLESCVTFP